jgi:hypothetical protein
VSLIDEALKRARLDAARQDAARQDARQTAAAAGSGAGGFASPWAHMPPARHRPFLDLRRTGPAAAMVVSLLVGAMGIVLFVRAPHGAASAANRSVGEEPARQAADGGAPAAAVAGSRLGRGGQDAATTPGGGEEASRRQERLAPPPSRPAQAAAEAVRSPAPAKAPPSDVPQRISPVRQPGASQAAAPPSAIQASDAAPSQQASQAASGAQTLPIPQLPPVDSSREAVPPPLPLPTTVAGAQPASAGAAGGEAPAAGATYVGEVKLGDGGAVKLSGIAFSDASPVAVINGKVLGPGEGVGDVTVDRIEPERVTLRLRSGVVFYLRPN